MTLLQALELSAASEFCFLATVSTGSFPAARCVKSIGDPTSVIPACFKRESRRIRTWTPIKTFGGDGIGIVHIILNFTIFSRAHRAVAQGA